LPVKMLEGKRSAILLIHLNLRLNKRVPNIILFEASKA
jgi:hypothetical protein